MSNTPKLRFKEFSGDWEKKKLGKITKLTDGVHFTPTYVESGVPFWSVETVVSNANPKYITQEAHNDAIKRCNPQINDILLTRIGTLAKPKLINWNEEFSIYVSLALIKASNNYNSKFARYYFETEYYQKDFLSKSLLTATPKKINMEDLKQTNIKLPSLEEQEKIASFFSLIDNKISLQGEKVEALKDYKKGMMQKIFSRELRFKDDDGIDYSEWEEKKLGDIATIVGGGTPSTTEDQYWNGEIQWFTPTEIKEQKFVSTSIRTITYEGLRKSSAKILPKGTILLTTRASLGDMAIANNEVTTNQGFQSIIAKDNVNNQFIYYLQEKIKKYCYKNASGSTFLEISKKTIESFKLKLPCLEEQNKIVEVLSILDNKIEKEQEKLNSLNEYKKGLLQQIFV